MSGLFVWYFWSLGSRCCLVWCPLRPAPSSDCCSLSSFSVFGCWDVRRRRFLLLCLSLSGAGEPQTPSGFVFPLVFLRPGRGLRLRPVPLLCLLYQGFAPHLFFFFCFRRRRSFAGSVFFSFLVLVLVGFSGGGFWSVCVSGFWCVRVRLFAKHVCIR